MLASVNDSPIETSYDRLQDVKSIALGLLAGQKALEYTQNLHQLLRLHYGLFCLRDHGREETCATRHIASGLPHCWRKDGSEQ